MINNEYFKDGAMRRDPRKPMTVSKFKHGKGYGYSPIVKKSPEQVKEAKK
jgi:hypothetical protein